ncbi:MAG: ABC transporter ATP-binding protein [Melioribacter sp.]|nr:ABC transporter ATP-binding protein [Melioribacter sp.]
MDEYAIKLENICKEYKSAEGNRVVLQSINLYFPAGQSIAVVGPNGSGKSTFLKIVLGLTKPDFGSVTILNNGKVNDISYIPQDYRNSFFPWLRLKTNLALHLEKRNHDHLGVTLELSDHTLEKFIEAAKDVQLIVDLNKFPYQLSGGEQQIMVLLQALLRKPKLIIADEPLSAIDIHKKELILLYLSNFLIKEKPTTLIVSHDIEDALFLADRVVVFSKNTGFVTADFLIEKQHPRPNEWRYEPEFRTLVKRALEAFE